MQGHERAVPRVVHNDEHLRDGTRPVEGVVSLNCMIMSSADADYNFRGGFLDSRELRDVLEIVWQKRDKNKVFTLFVLLIESGTLYVVMLASYNPVHLYPYYDTFDDICSLILRSAIC